MTTGDTGTWPARMANVAEATAFVESFCDAQGLASDDALRLTLVVEELFTNTVTHGHGGDCDAPVRIALSATAAHVELAYDDTAPPFDPVAHLARTGATLDAEADDRRVGGVGIALVLRMAERASYSREDGCNRLKLTIARDAG